MAHYFFSTLCSDLLSTPHLPREGLPSDRTAVNKAVGSEREGGAWTSPVTQRSPAVAAEGRRSDGPNLMYLVRNFISPGCALYSQIHYRSLPTENKTGICRMFFIIEMLNGPMKCPSAAAGAVWAWLVQIVRTDTEERGEATERDQE